MALMPTTILPWTPSVLGSAWSNVTLNQVLPFCPTTMVASFKLGYIQAQVTLGTAAGHDVSDWLAQAGRLVGRDSVTAAQLARVLDEIVRFESHVSIITRVRGFFSFVNIIWLLAIVGIAISIGPSIFQLLVPLRAWLMRMLTWLAEHVVAPVVQFLHDWGVLELAAWVCVSLYVADGFRMDRSDDTGMMVALTGAVLSLPCIIYSTFLWGGHLVKRINRLQTGQSVSLVYQLLYAWIGLCWLPCAVYFRSTLFAYGVVVSLYSALGFGVACGYLCVFIGFDSHITLHRCLVASYVMLTVFVATWHFSGAGTCASDDWPFVVVLLRVLAGPVHVFGSVVLLLALLIASGSHYTDDANNHDGRRGRSWVFYNVLMGATLATLSFVGHTLHLTGMANVATVFACIWLVFAYSDFHLQYHFSGWILMLLLSVIAWRTSLFLHANPAVVASFFSME